MVFIFSLKLIIFVSGCSVDSNIQGVYITGFDKVLLINDKGIGVRSDYSGVLLLDTILQTPITKPDEIVKLELPLSEVNCVLFDPVLENLHISLILLDKLFFFLHCKLLI